MKDKIINFFARIAGVGKIWALLNGKKSYVAGTAGVLTGAAGLLLEITALIEKQDIAAVIEFGKNLPADQNWLTLLAGLATLGLRHAIEKKG